MQHQEIAVGRSVYGVAVDANQTEHPIAHYRTGDLVHAVGGAHGERQNVNIVRSFARACFSDRDSSFTGNIRGIYQVKLLVEETAEQTFENRGDNWLGF